MSSTIPNKKEPGAYLTELYTYVVDTYRDTPTVASMEVMQKVAIIPVLSMREIAKIVLEE